MKKIYLRDFGIQANTKEDVIPAWKAAVKAASKEKQPCEIILSPGVYDVYDTHLYKKEIHISNTHSEEESPDITRNIFIMLDGLSDLTINGAGCIIKSHGKMTQIAILNCDNVCIKNMSFDYINPAVTEMTVIGVGAGYIDCQVNSDSLYRIKNGKIEWYGDNFCFSSGVSQIYDSKTGFTWREYGPMQDKNAYFEELSKNVIRVRRTANYADNPYKVEVGQILQMRDPLRDECGIIIDKSRNTHIENVTMHFMNGLGLVAQNSEDIFLDGFSAVPSYGRTCACFADFMHFSGCRGTLKIENGQFVGAHDDAINIHGTYLKITEVDRENKRIKLRFMHPQTFGIGGFLPGDKIAATDIPTLLQSRSVSVVSVNEISPREMWVTVDDSIPELCVGAAVENISATPAAEIRGNWFERIPTRGVLATTRKKVVIENNVFTKINRCGVFISDDAADWFESGPVEDVLIKNNIFNECKTQFLYVKPENTEYMQDRYLHKNICVTENKMHMSYGNEILNIKNCDGMMFYDNEISGNFDEFEVILEHCKNIKIGNNRSTAPIKINAKGD